MALAILTNDLTSKLDEIIDDQDDWTDEKKQTIQLEYMKIFNEVWSEALNIFNNPNVISTAEPIGTAAWDDQQSSGEAQDTIEDVEIRHEGTLIAVTKKRKKFPSRLSALLGKTTRLQSNTAEKLIVDLPPRAPLEVNDGSSHLDEKLDSIVKETLNVLRETTHSIQPHTQRLMHIVDAAQVIINNQYHPIETLITSIEQNNGARQTL